MAQPSNRRVVNVNLLNAERVLWNIIKETKRFKAAQVREERPWIMKVQVVYSGLGITNKVDNFEIDTVLADFCSNVFHCSSNFCPKRVPYSSSPCLPRKTLVTSAFSDNTRVADVQ